MGQGGDAEGLTAGDAAQVSLPFALGIDSLIGHGADGGIREFLIGGPLWDLGGQVSDLTGMTLDLLNLA
jgi:hypothetical protein